MIDIRQLKYFIAVAETSHVGRAAELLNMSQPPLSRQISLLEKELKAGLFIRHPKGVSLTPAGEQFLTDAKGVVTALEQACRNASQVAHGEAGELVVGFMMHTVYNIVPALTKGFMTRYPDIKLRLQEVVPSELIAQVQKGDVDAAIMLNPGSSKKLSLMRIREEVFCLAIPAEHPLASKALIDADDLENQPLIATPQRVAPILRDAVDSYCARAGFSANVILETQLQQTIISLVAEGLGIAMVPEAMKNANVNGVVYRPLHNAPVVEYVILWRKDNINPALQSFLSVSEGFCLL